MDYARGFRFPSSHACLLVLLALGLGGCAAAALPVAADVAGTAIDKGPGAINAGKVETHQPLSMDELAAITRQAADELALTSAGQKVAADKTTLKYHDDRKQDISVTLVRRTSRATQIIVDVGWFGDGAMGQLVLRQILHDMPPEAVRTPAQTGAGGSRSSE